MEHLESRFRGFWRHLAQPEIQVGDRLDAAVAWADGWIDAWNAAVAWADTFASELAALVVPA